MWLLGRSCSLMEVSLPYDGHLQLSKNELTFPGHNNILYYAPVLLAVMRAFGAEDESEGSE